MASRRMTACLAFLAVSAHAETPISLSAEDIHLLTNQSGSCDAPRLVFDLITAEIARELAPFDVVLTHHDVNAGLGSAQVHWVSGGIGSNFGVAEDIGGTLSGHRTIEMDTDLVQLILEDELGAEATCAQLAQAYANVVVHEIGHELGLMHPNRYDECVASAYDVSPLAVEDEGHYMFFANTVLTLTERHFSDECSTPMLLSTVGARNEGSPLIGEDGGEDADLPVVAVKEATELEWGWHGLRETAIQDRGPVLSRNGGAGTYLRVGEFTGDDEADALYGVPGETQVAWLLMERRAEEYVPIRSFGLGRVGDTFLVGDTDGDGVDELVAVATLGLPEFFYLAATTAEPASGEQHRSLPLEFQAGGGGALHFLADADGDGTDDLITARASSMGPPFGRFWNPSCTLPDASWSGCISLEDQRPGAELVWFTRPSDGVEFSSALPISQGQAVGRRSDRLLVGDVIGNLDRADLVVGTTDLPLLPSVHPLEAMTWETHPGTGTAWIQTADSGQDVGVASRRYRLDAGGLRLIGLPSIPGVQGVTVIPITLPGDFGEEAPLDGGDSFNDSSIVP